MIRIGVSPSIVHEEDRWGVSLPTFMVHGYFGYVDKKFWEDLKEFQNHSIAEEVADLCYRTGTSYQSIVDGEIDLPITKRLITMAHGQVWQFNMMKKPSGDEWIRSFACLGEKTHKRWTFVDDLKLKYLNWKCKKMNEKVHERNRKTIS